jgi:GTP-binding protein
VADYPFTTLTPHLGVVGDADDEFVLADVPGLIEGAHQGSGLGHRFLRHLLRTRLLVYLIDVSEASGRDPVEDISILRDEVQQYGHGLERLPAVVAANKIDILYDGERVIQLERSSKDAGMELWSISAATGEGTRPLIRRLSRKLRELDLEVQAGEVQ